MNRYVYEGAVMEFERCINSKWTAETSAPTEAKARSNLMYRYKKETGRTPQSKITLPGKIRLVS